MPSVALFLFHSHCTSVHVWMRMRIQYSNCERATNQKRKKYTDRIVQCNGNTECVAAVANISYWSLLLFVSVRSATCECSVCGHNSSEQGKYAKSVKVAEPLKLILLSAGLTALQVQFYCGDVRMQVWGRRRHVCMTIYHCYSIQYHKYSISSCFANINLNNWIWSIRELRPTLNVCPHNDCSFNAKKVILCISIEFYFTISDVASQSVIYSDTELAKQ